ncbi:MAG: NAD(P)/FAD-dependent oxidoreductase, partial [Acidimicrobiales bacterium]
MPKQIVILGGGTGGTLTANRLRRAYPRREATIAVVDRDDRHIYQPGQVPVAFGISQPKDIVRSRSRQLRAGVDFHEIEIDHVDLDEHRVHLAEGTILDYDVLVVATGASLAPEATPGLTGPGWMDTVHTFYDLEGAAALSAALERFDKGRLVVGVVDMPIKCPVAPLEFCLLADWYFTERHVRDHIEITFLSPLPSLFAAPIADESVEQLFADKRVDRRTGFHISEVDGASGRISAQDGREVGFDLAVVVPSFRGSAYIGRSPGLGNDRNFIEVDTKTLQSPAHPEVFAIGDAADLPTSKTGSVAHFEGEVVVHNVRRFLAGQLPDASYDGHGTGFIETGFHKAMLLDSNYTTQPLPGHFPTAVGLPLLKDSRLSHLAKVEFQWFYWHFLLPGRGIPGLGSAMPMRGKAQVADLDAAPGAPAPPAPPAPPA